MYLVVRFTNEKEMALIPSTWLDGDGYAKWPPYKNPDKINNAVKDKVLPESNWKSYPIEGLFGNSSYEKAWKWLKEETEKNEMKPIRIQEPDLKMHVVKREHGSDLALQPDTSDTIEFDPEQHQHIATEVESVEGKRDQENPAAKRDQENPAGRRDQENQPPCKKQRRANWSNKEVWMLLEEVRLEKVCLTSTVTNEISNRKKYAVWQRIADKLTTSCGIDHRSVVSVREKWGTLKSEAQRRRDKRRSTVGGAVKECEYDNLIFEILGERSYLTDGINGGIDMFSLNTSTNCSDMPSMTVTGNSVTCVENDRLSLEDIPSTSFGTENSVKLVEDTVADSSQNMPSMTVTGNSVTCVENDRLSLEDMPSMTVTGNGVTCVENDRLSLEDIPSTSFGTNNSVKLVEGTVADSSQRKPWKDANRGKKKQNKTKSVLLHSAFGSPLGEEYLKSEIEKNKSIVELNKMRMEVLRKILLREEEKSDIDIWDRVTYV